MEPLRSLDVLRTKKHINGLGAEATYARGQVFAAREATTRIEKEGFDDAFMFPFRIYSFPSCWRASPDIAVDWLKFRVHAGRFMGTVVTGTDGADVNPGGTNYPYANPDADGIPGEADVTDITIPAGVSLFFFWIDSTTSTPALKFGYTGSTTSGGTGPGGDPVLQGWTSYPVGDDKHTPIGFVDVATRASDHEALIRQLARTDISAGGGSGGAPVWLP